MSENSINMTIDHNLKILPEYYIAVSDGSKTFEIRKNDRDFHLGDILGKPREVSLAEGKLDGVCMALGLEYEIKNKVIVFKTFLNEKVILELPFDPQEPF